MSWSYNTDQYSNNKVKHIPVVLPETSEVVQPFQPNFCHEYYQRNCIQKVEHLLHYYYAQAVGDRKFCKVSDKPESTELQ